MHGVGILSPESPPTHSQSQLNLNSQQIAMVKPPPPTSISTPSSFRQKKPRMPSPPVPPLDQDVSNIELNERTFTLTPIMSTKA